MFDILGAMTLSALAVLFVGTLAASGARSGKKWGRFAGIAAMWFVVIAGLAASGTFTRPGGAGTIAIGAAVVTPVVAGLIAFARSQSVRAFVLGIPLAVLVAVHVGRSLGAFFVALHGAGRLPPTFALTAGWGDILVAVLAVPVALAIHTRASGWRSMAWAWNSFAFLDLIVAVSLGVGSAPDSPVRFIFEAPNSGAIASLPWVMIPGFLVPLYLLTHVAIFARLAMTATSEKRGPLPESGRDRGLARPRP